MPLLLIIMLCFTCGERKIWSKMKKCQNIVTMFIVTLVKKPLRIRSM